MRYGQDLEGDNSINIEDSLRKGKGLVRPSKSVTQTRYTNELVLRDSLETENGRNKNQQSIKQQNVFRDVSKLILS